jgi:hypothetical protein
LNLSFDPLVYRQAGLKKMRKVREDAEFTKCIASGVHYKGGNESDRTSMTTTGARGQAPAGHRWSLVGDDRLRLIFTARWSRSRPSGAFLPSAYLKLNRKRSSIPRLVSPNHRYNRI